MSKLIPALSDHARLQHKHSKPLVHSSKRPVCNAFKSNHLRTLCQTWGVYPYSSHFGTRRAILNADRASTHSLLLPLCPPAAMRRVRIQLEPTRVPPPLVPQGSRSSVLRIDG